MTPADEAAELLRAFSQAGKGSVFPFRGEAAALLAEYDRRLHAGSPVVVHIGDHRYDGVVKTLGNTSGPLVVVVDSDARQRCGVPVHGGFCDEERAPGETACSWHVNERSPR